MTKKRKFEGVWIKKDVWQSKDLTLQEKVLIVEIDSLDNENGCFASNEYLAKFFSISMSRVSKIISQLKKKGYVEEIGFDGRFRSLRSLLDEKISESESDSLPRRKQLSRVVDSCDHNSIVNNKVNITDKSVQSLPSSDQLVLEEKKPLVKKKSPPKNKVSDSGLVFEQDIEITKWVKCGRKNLNILALYINKKETVIDNASVLKAIKGRFIKDATNLIGYDIDDIEGCMNWLNEQKLNYDWKLGSVGKQIDKYRLENGAKKVTKETIAKSECNRPYCHNGSVDTGKLLVPCLCVRENMPKEKLIALEKHELEKCIVLPWD